MIKARFKKPLLGTKGKFILDIDLEIEEKEIVALFGESGAGKSTILRVLAGLEKVDEGYIEVNHSIWLDTQKKFFLKPQNRKIGFVFQDYALFPHLNVYQNIAFANPKDKNKINEVLHLMRLENLSKQKISQLSGGQAQRVALARAIIGAKEFLFLDEALNALDPTLKNDLQTDLLHLIQRFSLSVILVSHNQDEILKLAHKVLLLKHGKITSTSTDFFTPTIHFQAQLLHTDENHAYFKPVEPLKIPKKNLKNLNPIQNLKIQI
ncbi:ATP-binding cassette domain-containing protein [Helicobacter cetorum]|uniref:Molybdenum ABC transporter ModD n=1 Tax=Helicobacter cetorum (strain ATCC BAA-540 / CCUG 52418 / MIT 99-5656) TaxID=1163745 RepID=I0ET71_HELCM|nr:molybdenum ABC transporter ModD [Helicobacter cetorum MIT 99-5656]